MFQKLIAMAELNKRTRWNVKSFGDDSEKAQKLSQLLQDTGYVINVPDERYPFYFSQYFLLGENTDRLFKLTINKDNELVVQSPIEASNFVIIASLEGDKISFRDHSFTILDQFRSQTPLP